MSDDSWRDRHVAAGARFADDSLQVLDYGDAAAEYEAVRNRSGVIDRSDLGVVEVTGRDRASFLHAVLSNDVKSLAPGQGCAASLLDVHGKVETFAWVLALDDRILVLTPPALGAKAAEMLDRYLFSEKAYLRDATGEQALLMLAGPEANQIVKQLTGADVPAQPWSHTQARIASLEARVVRGGGETGQPEAWLMTSTGDTRAAWDGLREHGVRPVGRTAWESLRIEAGTPVFGSDADPTVLLPEIPFADKVSYDKGCYVGQEVVVRIRDRGHVNRLLCGLALEGDVVPPRDAAIVADGDDVGHVTSATWSFGLRRPIALGFIKRRASEPGTRVGVRLRDATLAPAVVSALPFTR